ncbi:MAG TPA: hypothetical protein VFT39_16365 [Vicinamibacterales bacterium]|nr:hypothetical protein [Vicinamibacterales bacterium]
MARPERFLRGSVGLRLKVVLALYMLAAALLPLGHHDLACHIKSTTHCTTCAVGSSAEAAADPAVLARSWLFDAGSPVIDSVDAPHSASRRPASGRAPPLA